VKNQTKFKESPVSESLLEYFNRKFPETIAPIALFKALPIVSCKLPRPRLSILDVAPPRQMKTYTSNVLLKIFSEEFYLNLRSDFTMNSLKRYKKEIAENRCWLINDGTTLLASKAQRTKDRLVGGFSEMLADSIYTYQDFNSKFVLKGWTTQVMNITAESFLNYKDRLLGLTFLERAVTLYHCLTQQDMAAWVAQQRESQTIKYGRKITVADIELKVNDIPMRYIGFIQEQAQEISYQSLKGFIACQDLIKGLLKAHASLNQRCEICDDDLMLLDMIKPYLTNPFSPYEGQIVKLRAQGLSYNKIQEAIGKKNYRRQIQKVIQKAQIRGILPV
jgi:hypothetical protein